MPNWIGFWAKLRRVPQILLIVGCLFFSTLPILFQSQEVAAEASLLSSKSGRDGVDLPALLTTTQILTSSPSIGPIKYQDYQGIASIAEAGLQSSESEASAYPYNSFQSGAFFFPPYLSNNERFGFGKTSPQDTSVLKAGWYVDWGASGNPPHPDGVEYGRTIIFSIQNTGTVCPANGFFAAPAKFHNQVTPSITGTALIQNLQANPGAWWMIGNEPDTIYQRHPIEPELYAELYHDFYTLIKSVDPTAKVSIAAVSQVSPLRIKYLDRVLNHYQVTYGQPMPIDVWNIHLYRLNEAECSWGVSVPPGVNFSEGPGWDFNSFGPDVILNLTEIENTLRNFRSWMHARGYGNKPLIISEFGVVFLPEHGYTEQIAAQYLSDATNLFLNAKDPTTGYAQDGGRLVQRWAWFSTSYHQFGGSLFYKDTNTLTPAGQIFAQLGNAHYTPYVDLQLIPPYSVSPGTDSLNVKAYLRNWGNTSSPNTKVRVSLVEKQGGGTATEMVLDLGTLLKRYGQSPKAIDHTWQIAYTQAPTLKIPYTLQVAVDSPDANTSGNVLSFNVDWWQVADLAISNLTLSSPAAFPYKGPKSMVATATVKNAGTQPTPSTQFQFKLKYPNGQTEDLTTVQTVAALQPGQTRVFTTNVLINQGGNFVLTALLPTTVGPAEITNNNAKSITIVAADKAVYLPLVKK